MDKWIKSQVDKYGDPKRGFGEADKVVNLKLKAYEALFEYAQPGMSFLDLGTNSGRVAHEMHNAGLIELGVDLPQITKQIKYPINKTAINLEEDYPDGEWDLIFCREVIEHLRNYQEVCKKIISSLSCKGILIITAPNNKNDGPKNCPQHVRIFEKNQLDKLIQNSGGKVIRSFNERRQHIVVAKRKLS